MLSGSLQRGVLRRASDELPVSAVKTVEIVRTIAATDVSIARDVFVEPQSRELALGLFGKTGLLQQRLIIL